MLLVASYYFYMSWKMEYIVLIMGSTVIDYFAAKKIAGATLKEIRRRWLVLSLLSNLGILFGFKYFNFFSDSARQMFEAFDLSIHVPYFDVLLPVGISFYTFQTLSYTIDVYRGKTQPEKHFGIFALYVSFFPQLVAGPIERSTHLLPQFRQKVVFSYENFRIGLWLMALGFYKKLVIADRVAIYVNEIYADPQSAGGMQIILATFFFAFQIYCDFSGYSDIAIGSARLMGYDLMENFKRPYFARSLSDFWRRWHVSLSSWFKDYLYIPLGGNRKGYLRLNINLMIVFLVSGLWHGANWTFVLWGGIHGSWLVLENFMSRAIGPKIKLPRLVSIFITFSITCLGWIFFRADNVGDAFILIRNIFQPSGGLSFAEFTLFDICLSLALIGLLELYHIFEEKDRFYVLNASWFVRWPAYIGVALLISWFGKFFEPSEFIYFQF